MATWDGNKFDSLGSGDKYPFGGHKEPIIRYKNKLFVQFDDFYLHAYDYNTGKWQKIPGKFDDFIRDATVFNDELIIVGDFQHVDNIHVRSIVKFNGTNYDTLPKPLFASWLSCVQVFKNELYIGGNFDPFPFQAIAKYNGVKWISASPNLTINALEAWDFEIYNDKLFVCGKWSQINGENMPSIASWDGKTWNKLGQGLTFEGGMSGAPTSLKVFNNKLYVFGGFDYADTVKVKNMAVWNDTIWCKTTPTLNFMPTCIESYKGKWYMGGHQKFLNDTVNYLGVYVANNGKLEGNCFDKPITEIAPEEIAGGLFPNPCSGSVTFNVSNIFGEYCNLKIANQLGQIISDLSNIRSNSKFDLSNFSKGIYLFIFEGNSNRQTYKVLKE